MLKIKSFSAKTNQGPYLQLNEDTYEVDLVNDLIFVLDGIGGGNTEKIILEIKENIHKFYLRFGGDPNTTMPFYYNYRYLLEGNALINSLFFSHKKVLEQNQKLEMDKRSAASGAFLASSENILTFIGIGSVKSYLFRKGSLMEVIRGDILAYVGHDFRHDFFLKTSPLNAIGLFEDLSFEYFEVKIQNDDLVLILTDGAYARCSHQEIHAIVEQGNLSLNQKIDKIFEIGNQRGNLDNQTGILIQY